MHINANHKNDAWHTQKDDITYISWTTSKQEERNIQMSMEPFFSNIYTNHYVYLHLAK